VTRRDIKALDPSELREMLELSGEEPHVLMGGPPCQGFSKMRNGNGNGDKRNSLVLRYLEYVAELKPRFALLENVPGLMRSEHGKEYFDALYEGLDNLKYKLVTQVVDAADYGVPQHRRRMILVAGRDGEVPPIPEATHGPKGSLDVAMGLKQPWRTVRDVISGYPTTDKDDPKKHESEYPNHVPPIISDSTERYLHAVPRDGGSRTEIPREMWLKCHITHGGHKDVYGRAAWDKPSNTMTTGCTNPSKGRFVHPEQDRAFTAREAAALQGFPDAFIFYGVQLARQIGNAVPPPLAYAFAEVLMQRLEEESLEVHEESKAVQPVPEPVRV
jgi:DNA (cytosine-5)-methyltransferase 1